MQKLVLRYTGSNCAGASCNDQGSKAEVSGAAPAGKALQISTPFGSIPGPIAAGYEFEVIGVFSAESIFAIQLANGVSTINPHTSCSVPLQYGDQFGSLMVVGFGTSDGQTEVT